MKFLKIFIVSLIILPSLGLGQIDDLNTETEKFKPKIYYSWGWNRAFYSLSDIHFLGRDYNFVLHDVKAHDRQTPLGLKYYVLGNLSVPQTNARFSYQFKPKWEVSIGDDHMKYIMYNNRMVRATGNINLAESDYSGNYSNDEIYLSPDFLTFEHTDGLNYINTSIRHRDLIWRKGKLGLYILEGLGVGVLIPRTNAKLLDKVRYDEFHLSGFGFDASLSPQLTIGKHFFLQGVFKVGYIHMPDIRTTYDKADKAKQSFTFFQSNFSIGYSFYLPQRKKK